MLLLLEYDYLLLIDVEELGWACCFADGACIETTEVDCNGQGGVYQGDGTNCLGDSDGDGGVEPCDNCPNHPNGPLLGTCTNGTIGQICTSNEQCDITVGDGFCSMNQEDNYPPGGNGLGDACECEGDFNRDGNVDAEDVTKFLEDFGRNQFNNPCP